MSSMKIEPKYSIKISTLWSENEYTGKKQKMIKVVNNGNDPKTQTQAILFIASICKLMAYIQT